MQYSTRFGLTALVLLLGLLILPGCGDSDDCTLIGCESGAVLEFEDANGQPINAFKGTITADGEVYTVECGEGAQLPTTDYLCRQNELFLRINSVREIALNIRATDNAELAYIGGLAVEFAPQYPNGEECGAACERAEKTVVLEPTQASA